MLWQFLYYYFFLLLIFCPTIIQSDTGCSNQQKEVNLEERKRFNNAFPIVTYDILCTKPNIFRNLDIFLENLIIYEILMEFFLNFFLKITNF